MKEKMNPKELKESFLRSTEDDLKNLDKIENKSNLEYFKDEEIVGYPWWDEWKNKQTEIEQSISEYGEAYLNEKNDSTKEELEYDKYSKAMQEQEELNRSIDEDVTNYKQEYKKRLQESLYEKLNDLKVNIEYNVEETNKEIKDRENQISVLQNKILEKRKELENFEKYAGTDSKEYDIQKKLLDKYYKSINEHFSKVNELKENRKLLLKLKQDPEIIDILHKTKDTIEKKPEERKAGTPKEETETPKEETGAHKKKAGTPKEETGAPKEKKGAPENNPESFQKEEESAKITVDAETGRIIFEKNFKDEAGEMKHFVDKHLSFEQVFEDRKKIMKGYIKYFEAHDQEKLAKTIKKLGKKINPAVMKVLFENEEAKLLGGYIQAVKDGDKRKLPFDYDINLTNPYSTDKNYENLNKQALIDNKNLGTEFDAVKNYRIKKLLSKFPINAKFVNKWIGKLPEPSKYVHDARLTEDQEKLNEEMEKRQKYEEYMKSKYPSKEAGPRTTSKGYRDAMRQQTKIVDEIEAQKTAAAKAEAEDKEGREPVE